MKRTEYVLRPRSGGWTGGIDSRLVHFDMTLEHHGKPLGGHNVQVVLGAPDRVRRGLDEEVALTLPSGWWVSLRNQFALAPCVALEILESASDRLAQITREATEATGEATHELSRKLFATVVEATGPDYWP